MRITKLALVSVALALPLSFQAHAADAIAEAPPAPPIADIETAPAYLWAGGYAGVFGGYNWQDHDAVADTVDGAAAGVYGGYNWQAGTFVYGVEADAGYSFIDETVGTTNVQQGGFGSLRARFGYDMNPFLIYGTVGGAIANTELTTPAGSDSATQVGWTAGAGVEAFVTERMTTRLEYRYTDYGSSDFDIGGTTVSSGFDDHSVRLGIGVKF